MKFNLLEKIDCPICKSKEFKIIKEASIKTNTNYKKKYDLFNSSSNHKLTQQLVKCKKCELVYVNPRLSNEIINKGYSYNKDEKFILQNQERIQTFKINLKKIIKVIGFNKKKISILDVGSAGGAFLLSINNPLMECDGIEPNNWLVEEAKKKFPNLNIYSTTLEKFNKHKKYDLITYWDVFEHLTDINSEIIHINKFLKNNSFLLLNIPDYGSSFRKLLGFKWPFFLDVHLYYFEKKTISLFMKNNGFNLLQVIKHKQILKLGYIIERVTNVFPMLKFLETIIKFLNFHNIKIKYNIGQNIYIFKKS